MNCYFNQIKVRLNNSTPKYLQYIAFVELFDSMKHLKNEGTKSQTQIFDK